MADKDIQLYISDPHGEYDEFSYLVTHAAGLPDTQVQRLHVLGDIYDRGPQPDKIMDLLCDYPADKLDIIWGNHDILWMGAALGQPGCVANAVRICARYGNLGILEDNYGMDLSALKDFAARTYADDPCTCFFVKHNPELTEAQRRCTTEVQKAIAIIQFKVEAQLIAENPSFKLESRNLLDKIDYQAGTVVVDGGVYPMEDLLFPTVDPADPFRMSPEESQVMQGLIHEFTHCDKLQRHAQLFLDKGSMYRIQGSNLLFHAAVPLNPDGSLMASEFYGKRYAGRALFDAVDAYVRDAYTQQEPAARKQGLDLLWYLWLGVSSPLFTKSKMATFELYFINDKEIQKEAKNSYYKLLEDEAAMDGILRDFGLDEATGRMISGHVPVKAGEDPVKCGGKVLIIDGGMSIPYRKTTGICGFSIVEDKDSFKLGAHTSFIPGPEPKLESVWREL